MDKKYSFPYISMYKDFFVQLGGLDGVGKILAIFCVPVAFLALIHLTFLMFFRTMVSSIFKLPIDYVEGKKNEKTAYRVALLVVLSPFFLLHFLFTGVFNILIFICGFVYDICNLIMRRGKAESKFVDFNPDSSHEQFEEENYQQEPYQDDYYTPYQESYQQEVYQYANNETSYQDGYYEDPPFAGYYQN